MKSFHFLTILGLLGYWILAVSSVSAAEPYPFKSKPREFPKTEYLRVDFEGTLPSGTELGEEVTLEPEQGTGKTIGIVSKSPGLIVKIPITEYDIGRSRFELSYDYGGKNFGYISAKLVARDKDDEELRSVSFNAAWGYTGMRAVERSERNLEFDDIYSLELVFEHENRANWGRKKDEEQVVIIDNIVLKRHEARVIYGKRARGELSKSLRDEDLEVTQLGELWVGEDEKRQSFFNFAPYKETDKFVRSHWQKRVHIGTTYKVSRGKLPTFILGVAARQAALDKAATSQKKSLLEMYEFFLDDVAEHGFNTVWVDFTKELEQFDQMASKRGISVILRDPGWSNLEKWVAKPNDPIPKEFKETVAKNMARYSKMKSLIGYHMDRPLSRTYEPMLAKAREHLASIAPNVQLVTEQSDIYASENMIEPYANFGIQTAAYNHYIGRPWGGISHMYHPNYWIRALTEGHIRRIHHGFEVRYMPDLITLPTGSYYGKKNINFQFERVDPEVSGWTYDEATKRWSGWYRYKFPPMLLRSLVWKILESGGSGVLFKEWGPGTIATDVTGSEILKDTKYGNTYYEPDLLRQPDMSESAGWKELGQVGRELSKYKSMLADVTRHGNNTATVDSGDVRVKTLTGRKSPFKLLILVNTKVGDYDEKDIKIDPDTGELEGYSFGGPETFVLTVKKDAGLIDLATGENLEPFETELKNRVAKYDITLGPGEGRFLFRGKRLTYLNFVSKYKIPVEKKKRSKFGDRTGRTGRQ